MAQDIEVAIIRTHFEVGIVRRIPAIQDLFHPVFVIADSKTKRRFVSLSSGIALYPHMFIVTEKVTDLARGNVFA